ncbi:putative carbon-monoxide dehydrogenase (acceptor), small subunit [delta proteobacterium NaphS2]|nr:putative carbon-monoxide dehydrogenase (acceptor), small subunit [delta proteobacterium NaphS2]
MDTYSVIPIRFTLNGDKVSIEAGAHETALTVIRERLSLKGTKEGCGMGECGACTILVDGKSVNACLMAAPQLEGRTVMTVEGLGREGKLHPLQEAFLEHHGVQCGFCTPGLLMSAQSLILETPRPTHKQVVEAISGNLCRCTGYQQIVDAIQYGADKTGGEE